MVSYFLLGLPPFHISHIFKIMVVEIHIIARMVEMVAIYVKQSVNIQSL